MRLLTILFLLTAVIDLLSQDGHTDLHRYSIGPGVNGECVDADDLQIRLSTKGLTFVGEKGESCCFNISGNSLYIEYSQSECYLKIGDIHDDVLGIAYNYRNEYLSIWTCNDEYRYVDSTGLIERFSFYGSLSSFLAYPVKSISAVCGIRNCFGVDEETITHVVSDPAPDSDSTFPSLRYEHKPVTDISDRGSHINEIDAGELARILRIVNVDPNRVPSLGDFDINEEDVAEYIRQVERRIEWEKPELSRYGSTVAEKEKSKEFYRGLLNCFDTVRSDVIQTVLLSLTWSRYSWRGIYKVRVINEVNDTLLCFMYPSDLRQPYNLPWTIHYDGEEFQTFNVDLARILMKLLPGHDLQPCKEAINKSQLLCDVADYLFAEKKAVQGNTSSVEREE